MKRLFCLLLVLACLFGTGSHWGWTARKRHSKVVKTVPHPHKRRSRTRSHKHSRRHSYPQNSNIQAPSSYPQNSNPQNSKPQSGGY